MPTLPLSNDAQPLLTICIPTYNRSTWVDALVDLIVVHILSNDLYRVNLVISNNNSTDDTYSVLTKYEHIRGVSIFNRDIHLGSAEENIINSIKYLSGDYVWFVGDDDIININVFEEVYKFLENSDFDCLIFNSPVVTSKGRMKLLRPIALNAEKIEGNINKIIETIGILNTFAGITNVIQRRSLLSIDRGLEWIKISKIYSHVAWIVEANSGSKAAFFNFPLVYYRANDYSDGHWSRVAERENVQSFYFWTIGVCSLLRELVNRNVISYREIGLIFEVSDDGRRYRLVDDVIFKTYQQLNIWCTNFNKREIFTIQEFNDIVNFCQRADPLSFYVLSPLKAGFRALQLSADEPDQKRRLIMAQVEQEFLEAFNDRQYAGQMIPYFLCIQHSYEIYRTAISVIALWQGARNENYKCLYEVDPLGDGVNVITGYSLADVSDKIKETMLSRPMESLSLRHRTSTETGPEDLRVKLMESEQTIIGLNEAIRATHASTSWRISAPIRVVARMLRGK
jgi:glycosyltransferase involved in cell wall biosynthesis